MNNFKKVMKSTPAKLIKLGECYDIKFVLTKNQITIYTDDLPENVTPAKSDIIIYEMEKGAIIKYKIIELNLSPKFGIIPECFIIKYEILG